jgi:streptogramin lyase
MADKNEVLPGVLVFAIFALLVPACLGQPSAVQPTLNITEYPLPQSGSNPWALTAGPDGAIWYTASCPYFPTCPNGVHDVIGRITTKGATTEYPLPGPSFGHNPYGITLGPTARSGLPSRPLAKSVASPHREKSRNIHCLLPTLGPTGSPPVRTAHSGLQSPKQTRSVA